MAADGHFLKTPIFLGFSEFKADLGSPRDRPFLLLCGFSALLARTWFVGLFLGFVGLLRGSLVLWVFVGFMGSSLDFRFMAAPQKLDTLNRVNPDLWTRQSLESHSVDISIVGIDVIMICVAWRVLS